MKQIKKNIIIILILIILFILFSSKQKSIQKTDITEHGWFGGGWPDFGSIVRGITEPIPIAIASDIGVIDITNFVANITRMAEPTGKIILLLANINIHFAKIMSQMSQDNTHVVKVTPTITKCIKRIDYSRQRITNINIYAKLVEFMLTNFRPRFIQESVAGLFMAIIDAFNYIKMATRTSFIDLHNTNPPLWNVITTPTYKTHIVEIVKAIKQISIELNKIIKITKDSLYNVKNLIDKDLVKWTDKKYTTRKSINNFINILSISKIKIFNIPTININISYNLLYTIIKKSVIAGTIPFEWNYGENIDFINSSIRNHPYKLKKH